MSGKGLRWTICGLLFLATLINYIDRQIIGILKPDLFKALGWTEQGYAHIVSAFQLAYAFGYLLGGRFMDRIGVKRGFPVLVGLWSLACAAHGLVRSIGGFALARIGLGLAEGGNFPGAIRTVSEWFPVRERALSTGIFNSASNLGAIFCPLLVPFIADRYGWPVAFYSTGALGLAWVAIWLAFYESPQKNPRLSRRELDLIEEGREPAKADAAVPWGSLLKIAPTWAYIAGQVLSGPVWWFYLFWLPDFLTKQFHLTSQETGYRVAAVYGISIIGSVGGGWLALALMARGWERLTARKASLLLCAVAVLPVFFAPYASNSWVAVLLVGLAAAAHQGFSANLYTLASDVVPKPAVSTLVGLGGFASGLAAIGVSEVVGHLLGSKTGYAPVFAWASTAYLLAVLIMHLLLPRERAT
jgi:ACS family hexuronate transporter-like MFS transporter